MLGLKIDIDDFYERIWAFKRNADRFMVSKGGSYMRFGILLSVTTAYPIANILMNGPLLSTLFPMRYKLNNQIPDRLKKMIDQQSYMWLEKEAEATTDAFFTFALQLDGHYGLDSLRMGSLSRATGARIALPFYVQFNDEDEAMEYAKKFLEPFDILGKKTQIAWDSTSGRRLLSTFVLSDEALAFLVTRDLYAVKQPYLVTREALVWFCHVLTYMFCFYALHAFAFKFDSVVFVIALPLLLSIAIFSAYEWNKFALYANEHHADISAANLSTKHTQGGQEYYSKFLLRNRLLRDLVQEGSKIFTPVGDVKKAIAKYVLRFDGINDVHSENDELILSVAGDDLPEEE